jgi:hypothetical protein
MTSTGRYQDILYTLRGEWRHHGWSVVWLGKAGLAGTESRTGREVPGTKVGAGSKRRRHVAKGLAAGRAMLGGEEIRANPVTARFTVWINTLNGGARHQGHNALPPLLPAQEMDESPLGSKEMFGRTG